MKFRLNLQKFTEFSIGQVCILNDATQNIRTYIFNSIIEYNLENFKFLTD